AGCVGAKTCIGDPAARPGGGGPVLARGASDPDVLAGRYRLRQGRLVGAAPAESAVPADAAQAVGVRYPAGAAQAVGAGYPAGAVQAAGGRPAARGFRFRGARARTLPGRDGRAPPPRDGPARIDRARAPAPPPALPSLRAGS